MFQKWSEVASMPDEGSVATQDDLIISQGCNKYQRLDYPSQSSLNSIDPSIDNALHQVCGVGSDANQQDVEKTLDLVFDKVLFSLFVHILNIYFSFISTFAIIGHGWNILV